MKTEKKVFKDLLEDTYILEALKMGFLSLSEELMRVTAISADVGCAYNVASGQIAFAGKKVSLNKLYPDPKQVSVMRMLLTDGTVHEFRLLEDSLRKEMLTHWVGLYTPWANRDAPQVKSATEKYGRLWIQCSNRAFEAMDMDKLIPEPGEGSEYWDKMVATAEDIMDRIQSFNLKMAE